MSYVEKMERLEREMANHLVLARIYYERSISHG